MSVVEYGIMWLVPAAVAVALVAGGAALRRRWPAGRALTVTAAPLAFAALAPYGCGQLHSNPPYTSCSSLSGLQFGFRPTRDSFWHNGHEILTSQFVLLGYAVALAATVLMASWFLHRAVAARRRRNVGHTAGVA